MRFLLAIMFFAPLVAIAAVNMGADRVLPLMMAMSALAVIAYVSTFFRKGG